MEEKLLIEVPLDSVERSIDSNILFGIIPKTP